MFYGWIIIIFCIIAQLIGANLMAKAATEKGYGPEAHILAICFWLGIFGYLYTLSLPDKLMREEISTIRKELINRNMKDVSDELPDL